MFSGFMRMVYRRTIRRLKYPRMETNVTLSRSAVVDASARIAHDVFIGEKVSIGALSYVNVGTWVQSGSIGKYCSIAPGCYIGGGNHAIEYVSTSQRTYWADGQKLWGEFLPFENIEHPPQIGNDVWIGAHAIILQRVTIGDGAVVAAGSIVTKDVPPYSIVAGNPARVVKMRFSEEKIDYLTKLRWWDLDQSELKKLGPMFLAGKEWYHSRPTGQEDCSP